MKCDGNYKNCRWCGNYDGGSCAADWFTVETDYDGRMMDAIEYVEQGKMDAVIRETIEGTVVERLSNIVDGALSQHRIGKERKMDIMAEVIDEMRDYIEIHFIEELKDNLDRSIDNSIIDNLEVYVCPRDESEFVCSEFR